MGDADFETDGTKVNTRDGWMGTKIGIFVKRPQGESAEAAQWAERTLPAPTARFAFARIAECSDFAGGWAPTAWRLGLDPQAGTITVLCDGAA